MHRKFLTAAALSAVAFAAHATSDAADPAMLKLASRSGCLACHHVQADPKASGQALPVGPAWSDVAIRYAGVPGAADQLTRTVMTGSNPYASHWKGKANGLAMPPNAVAIREQDAAILVGWILGLPAPAPEPSSAR